MASGSVDKRFLLEVERERDQWRREYALLRRAVAAFLVAYQQGNEHQEALAQLVRVFEKRITVGRASRA